jgi:hypothetical protein
MNPASFRNNTMHSIPCKFVTTLTVALACALAASNATAQVLVTDNASISNNKAGFAAQLAKTVDQYAKQIEQYTLQVQQYEQMLTKVESLGTNFQLLPNNLQKIDADTLVQANCSGSSGGIVSNLLNNATSMLTQSITQNQQNICAQIVITQVDKYNATVDMLNTLSSDSAAVKKLDDLANSFTNLGQSSSVTTQAADLSNQVSAQVNAWNARIKADDAVISSLQGMQSTLAQMALNGSNGSMLSNALPDSTFQNVMSGLQ